MTSSWRRGVTAGLILCALWGGIVHAQEDVEQARGNAQQWLVTTLGKPTLKLLEYTYGGSSWDDSSLGCPVPGESYTKGTVQGYEWTFLFDNQVRYEVHSTIDGTQSVLCSSVNVAPDVRLSSYSAPEFTILVPEAWVPFPNAGSSEILFAPRQQTACSLPGMRVTVLGRVASGVTTDQLLDDYLVANGAQDTPTQRQTLDPAGRTTTFETSCEDGTRRWRLSAFVDYGSAYRIEQWTPQDDFEQWNPYFMNMLDQFTLPNAAPAADTTSQDAAPQSAPTLPVLPMVHVFVGDIFVGTLNDLPGRSVTSVPDMDRHYLTFSPDGLLVAFINQTSGQLRVIDVAQGLSARKLADNASPAFPPAWSLDGQQIAYVGGGEGDTLSILAVPAAGGVEPQTLGTFAFGGDCTVSTLDPADPAYFKETGSAGRDNVLVWLPENRFLISTRCDGGLGLLNLADGQVTVLADDVIGGTITADRTRFAARTPSGLAVLDFQTWQRTNYTLGPDVRQIAWEPGGAAVIFSREVQSDSLTLDDPALQERGEAVFGIWPVTVTAYDLALVRLDLTSSQDSVLWQGQGRGIGRIAPAPDGSGLLFSVVPSSARLVEAFQAPADHATLRAVWPSPGLFWLPTGNPVAVLLAYSGQPAFAPITIQGE